MHVRFLVDIVLVVVVGVVPVRDVERMHVRFTVGIVLVVVVGVCTYVLLLASCLQSLSVLCLFAIIRMS